MTWLEDHILGPISDAVPGLRSLSYQELGWFWDAFFCLAFCGIGFGLGRL